MKHSEYVTIIEGFGKKALSEALIKVVVKNLPLFATGPWNYILIKCASKLAEELVEQGEVAIFFQYMDFRTDAQAKDFEDAMIYNHTMQSIGTEQEKKDAEAKLVEALNHLVTLSK